jgi:glycosyltransferase involved in cell wall biosynthesis
MVSERLRVAYLVKTFPRVSETFILNEILGVEELGLELEIFSLRKPPPANEPVHPDVAKVKAPVRYIPSLFQPLWPPGLALLLFSHLALLFAAPQRYFAAARFHFSSGNSPRLKDFLQAGYLGRALSRGKFTHLHAHFANAPTTVAEIVKHLTGIGYSFTAHAKDVYLTPPSELARKIKEAKCVLTCTAVNQRYLAGLADQGTPVRLAYHGVDVSRFRALSSGDSPQNDGVPLILSVARLCEKKGLEFLIEACRILVDRGVAFQCRIVGYGPLEDKLQKMIATLALRDRVFLLGKMTQDQLAQLYPQSNLFVLPCMILENGDQDGIPNVLFEAMVCGVPIVSTEIPGICELIEHQKNGLLVEQRNARALADAIELLIGSPGLRNDLALKGRQTVLGGFTRESSARNVYNILSSVLDSAESTDILRKRVGMAVSEYGEG